MFEIVNYNTQNSWTTLIVDWEFMEMEQCTYSV